MLYRFSFVLLCGLLLTGCRSKNPKKNSDKTAMKMQPPLETIRREHEVIQKVAAAGRKDAEGMRISGTADRERMKKYIDFFSNFTDACHHRKEELFLFPSVEWHDREEALIETLRADHKEGRRLLGRMRNALPEDEKVDTTALADALVEYTEMLETHILRENEQLLPVAKGLLPEHEQRRIAQGYVYVEHDLLGQGFHKKYHALAKSLISQQE